jgi:hypothetical protein
VKGSAAGVPENGAVVGPGGAVQEANLVLLRLVNSERPSEEQWGPVVGVGQGAADAALSEEPPMPRRWILEAANAGDRLGARDGRTVGHG